ncbi:hypothetical protein ACOMHN_055031 [Nucella lapillus]
MARVSCLRHVVRMIRCVTVEPVLFLFMFASSLTFSAFLAMTYDKSCLSLYNDTVCREWNANKTIARNHSADTDRIQHEASAWIMRSNIAITIPATASLLLFLGSWGDRVGRRLPLLVPCVASIVYSVGNILNSYHMHWPLAYTLIGPVFSGLGGSYLAVLMAGYTYLTHLADGGSRMMRVGVAESAVFLSSTVSVFVSGLLVDRLGYVPTFGIALGCQTVALLYVLLVLPEIKTEDQMSSVNVTGRSGVTCCPGAFLSPLRHMWNFLRAPRAIRVKVHLALFIVVLDILQLCTTGEGDILLLYLKRSPRNWSYTAYGYFKGAENFTRGAAVLLLLPLLKKMASPRDTTLIMAGLVSKIAGLILLGLAKESWTIFLVVAVACLQGFPSAGLRSLMAGMVLKEEQGRLFGVVASTESVVSLTATLMFNGLYPLTLGLYDGLSFQLAAAFVFLSLLIVLFQHADRRRTELSFERLPDVPPSDVSSSNRSSQADSDNSLQLNAGEPSRDADNLASKTGIAEDISHPRTSSDQM